MQAVTVAFDKRCCTLPHHLLYVHLPGRDYATEGERFGGPSDWAASRAEPLCFADTDTVVLAFRPEGGAGDTGPATAPLWGFRCVLTGKVEVEYPVVHWLHDTWLVCALRAARLVRLLVC